MTGFSLVNLWMGDASGGLRKISGGLDLVLFVLNALIGPFLLLISFVDPVDFFSEVVVGYMVGYGIHIFCFYSAVGAALLLSYSRRLSLIVPRLPIVDADALI